MEKIIEIDIQNENNFFETYSRKKVSKELINYLVESCNDLKKNDTIKIILNDFAEKNIDCEKLIKEGLKNEYDITYKKQKRINLKQLTYLVFGVATLFLSTLITEVILREVLLIFGWVFIWYLFEYEIFSDVDIKKRRRILKKLLESEFKENEMR